MNRAPRPLWPLLAALAAGAVGVADWWVGHGGGRAPPSPLAATRGAPSTPPCPAEHLLDDGVCVPLPPPEEREPEAASRIDLLPGRPPAYTRYLTPIARLSAAPSKSGLGVFVAAPRDTPVMAIELEAQVGPARRLTPAGPAQRLLTLHRVERAGATRTYVLEYDGIAIPSSNAPGEVPAGTPLGRVAAGPSPTGLAIEVRQLRRGVELETLDAERAVLDSNSLRCDARNVLPLKPAP